MANRNAAPQIPEVLFEDNHLLVVKKPPGLLSQSGPEGKPDLLTQCKEYLRVKHQKPGNVFLGLVHRLDWGVGGVMIFAKTSKAASRLAAQFRDRTVEKRYEAIVTGHLTTREGVLEAFLVKDEEERKARVAEPGEDATPARLSFRVLGVGDIAVASRRENVSLLEVVLESGRFHQIRAQLAAAGHPILGDTKYGSSVTVPGILLGLRAASLAIDHPTTGERKTFVVDRPDSWKSVVPPITPSY